MRRHPRSPIGDNALRTPEDAATGSIAIDPRPLPIRKGEVSCALQVLQGYHRDPIFSGTSKTADLVAGELLMMGIRVEVVSSHFEGGWPNGARYERVPDEGRPIHYLGHLAAFRNTAIDVAGWSKVFGALNRAQLVIVHGLRGWTGTWCAVLAIFLKRKFWLVPHGMSGCNKGRSRSAKRIFDRFVMGPLMRRADAVLVASDMEAAEVAATYGVAVRSISMYPLPVSGPPRDLGLHADASRQFRQSLGLQGNDLLALFVGRISIIKNLGAAIRAVAAVADTRLHLALVGPVDDKGYHQELVSLAGELGVQDRVHMPGPRFGTDQEIAIEAADFCVVPSSYENLCHFALEAHRYGKPLILSRNTGAAEILSKAESVTIVEPTSEGLETAFRLMMAMREPAH
jgi:glycosyltransferase involved in cell wall biosynthesis